MISQKRFTWISLGEACIQVFIHGSVIKKSVTDWTGEHAGLALTLPHGHVLQGGKQVEVVLQSGVPKKIFVFSIFFLLGLVLSLVIACALHQGFIIIRVRHTVDRDLGRVDPVFLFFNQLGCCSKVGITAIIIKHSRVVGKAHKVKMRVDLLCWEELETDWALLLLSLTGPCS